MGQTNMITEEHGNLLDSYVDALVNTVNTVGVMGKGIALQFRRAYPAMFADYKRATRAGEVQFGRMHVWESQALTGPRFVINFPTKGHWRAKSRLADIERGLADLVRVVRKLGIKSLALPPLGCGHGGLEWNVVEPRLRAALAEIPDVDVLLFPPGATPQAKDMRTETPAPKITPGRAALIRMLDLYTQRAAGASLIEVQKLLYFLQIAGEPLRLEYTKGHYGPYADNLRHVLNAVEGHYLVGFGDGSSPVLEAEPLRLLPGANDAANEILTSHSEAARRIDRVLDLAEGFESAYGMELLASVHWISSAHGDRTAIDAESAAELVRDWTPRKSRMFTPQHVKVAWDRLHEQGWLAGS